ncbi:hypothetical protein O7634_24125 [Micromonospora sp. WMMD1120]|uniref:hypothetical protein n=1 Tax=Micromonospora sp. WMMD1120 TaxID=3016106 RepID=UPI002416B87C|nr:hypothetical protein [Micromonospora sp. WMMD1120]MDG4809850.1 hypothetical protein [Micromonospora sp. WMMD1120]
MRPNGLMFCEAVRDRQPREQRQLEGGDGQQSDGDDRGQRPPDSPDQVSGRADVPEEDGDGHGG